MTKFEVALADAVVARLFTNGFSEQADRLVLTVDGPKHRDLGGWARLAVRDVVFDAVDAARRLAEQEQP